MKIKSLKIKDFRNIENLEILPCEEMNVICGENAQGKTNIVEAIWLFTGAKSFRGAHDAEMIKIGEKSAKLELLFEGEEIEKSAVIKIEEKRQAFFNDNKLKSASLLAGNFNAIVFSPADLRLVTDGPSVRRRFLDLSIGQFYPSYIELLREYMRAVTQRNNLIKEYKYDSTVSILLDVFEEEIAEKGKKIVEIRKRYIGKLNVFLEKIYFGLSDGNEKLETQYICSFKEKDLKNELILGRKEDSFSGSTSIGPHRDDLSFKINGLDARKYASQGQKRSIALAVKLAEAEVLKESVGESPICLMDDVMSELDPKRQNFVLNHIKGMQTFLTCCDPENVKNLEVGKIFNIEKGCVI